MTNTFPNATTRAPRRTIPCAPGGGVWLGNLKYSTVYMQVLEAFEQ